MVSWVLVLLTALAAVQNIYGDSGEQMVSKLMAGRRAPLCRKEPVCRPERNKEPACRRERKHCSEEKAIEAVRRIVKTWPDYANTGNTDYIVTHLIDPDASITVTGDPLGNLCDTRVESMVDYLYNRQDARILSDVVNIKSIKYKECDGSVYVNFVQAAGVRGHNLALYNMSWVFYPKCGCEYVLAEAAEIRVACLDQTLQPPVGCGCN